MPAAHVKLRRLLFVADLHAVAAARRKTASFRRAEQVGRRARNAHQRFALARVGGRQAAQQRLRVRMLVLAENLRGRAGLDHLARIHDGHAVGNARNHAEVHNLYRKSLRLIAVVAVTLTLASMFIIPCVARVFVGYDAELLALTSRAFRLYALSFLIMGFNVYASSFFTALGDGVTSALISFLRTLAFQVIAILLLPMLLGIDGIWLAVTAAELAALAVSAAMLLTKDKVFHYRKV